MIKNTYSKLLLLVGLLFTVLQTDLYAQANVQVRVTSVEVTQNEDCDGFLSGDSDFVWEFIATDNTLGRSNNNPSALGGILGDFNHAYNNGNNGPYVLNTPSGNFNPNNGIFFNHDYVCPTDVPTQINIDWRGYENDDPVFNYNLTGLFSDGETANQNVSIAVTPNGSNTQTFTASSTGGCVQTYRITFEVTHSSFAVTFSPNDICNAIQIPTNNTVQTFAWCGNLTPLQAGEPRMMNIANHGSAWFYFTAPASGNVTIETDHGITDFGTELVLYHAADGTGCIQGDNNWVGFTGTNPLKSKFDYLSFQGNADDDIPLITPSAKATAHFAEALSVFPSIPDGHALIPGETYYIQVTSDDNAQRGYIGISIRDRGGSPYRQIDIPCGGTDISADANSTTVRTEAGGQPFSTQLSTSRVSDEEIDAPYGGTNADQFSAYDYVPNGSNGLNGSMWVQFTAPNSGRIYFEGDLDNALVNESENIALYAPDPNFASGTPADLFCSNITQIAEQEGGTGILGANKTAVIMERCLEPGYTYYGMVDPQGAALANEAEVWVYDPSNSDPALNPPGNDILCLAATDTLYEVPVRLANQSIPFQSVAGDNTNACIERLAGEPVSAPLSANRADQTVWHYFVAPPSGVVEMNIRAYIGMNNLNWSVYELLNGTDCYGGLNPATYTTDGTQATNTITPIASGRTDFNGDLVGLCCLEPGNMYAIQLDGGAPGDVGQYIIEFIREVEVYAGDAQYSTNNLDTFTYDIPDTSFVCFGDTLFPSIMNDILGNTTARYPNCIDIGYMIHDSLNIPDSIINGNFTFLDTVYQQPQYWVNDGSHVFNQNVLHYVSPLADELATWGQLVCPSASAENGVPFIFLRQIVLATAYNQNNCIIDFTATGGLPQYNGTLFDYIITNSLGDTVSMGTTANGATQQYAISIADTYTITVTDSVGCGQVAVVNANTCLDPCINNPVIITPDPLDSTIYSCYPGGDSAMVTLLLTGGEPSVTAGSAYTSTISGSTAPSANGVYSPTGNGTGGATPLNFTVMDGDNWQAIVVDSNGCADTVSGVFDYNLTNCPDYCQLNPINSSFSYNCNMNGSALVQITVDGGSPAIDGSNYTVNIAGSTVFGQNYQNAQLPGVIGGSVNFSFVVNSGDNWQFIVNDDNGCADTLNDNYLFDTAHCPICTMMPVQILPDPVDSTVYTCYPNGTATVSLYLTGGDPFVNGSNFDVTVSGSSAGSNGTTQQGLGLFQFLVDDGDVWQAVALDSNGCADTVTGVFDYNLTNCQDFCQQQPISVGPYDYVCNGDGTATVNVSISGGAPGFNGSNYTIDVTGSTNGGNVTGATLAGIVGDTVMYSFSVDNGDTWTIDVTDNEGCNDNLSATYTFDINNCPNLCALVDLGLNVTPYNCFPDKTADVTIRIHGGTPAFDGSNYLVTIIGATTGASGYQLPVPGTIGDTTDYTFSVSDGDNWQVIVTDGNCTDSISGLFTWDPNNCGDLCNDPAYNAVLINNGTGNYTYACDSLGNGQLSLTLTGGLPEVTNGNDDYIAEVRINGNLATYLVNSNGTSGNLDMSLSNGDNWQVLVYDALRCDTASLSGTFVAVNAVATTTATSTMLIGQPATVDGSASTGNIVTYDWTPPIYLDDPTAATTTVVPLQETTYTLTVADSLGCIDSAMVVVPVGPCIPPNSAFTPNGDGVNELWEIPCLMLFDNRVQVYNRWGQLLFDKENYRSDWDGTNLGQDVPDATYYYVIEVYYPGYDEPMTYKGTVTIIR